MARLTILSAARRDLIEIGDFIARDNPSRAHSFVAEIEAIITDIIAVRPASLPSRDDLAPGLRAASHGRYRIFFQVAGEDVQFVRIIHVARDFARIFDG